MHSSTRPSGILILDFLASRTVRNKCLLFKAPRLYFCCSKWTNTPDHNLSGEASKTKLEIRKVNVSGVEAFMDLTSIFQGVPYRSFFKCQCPAFSSKSTTLILTAPHFLPWARQDCPNFSVVSEHFSLHTLLCIST